MRTTIKCLTAFCILVTSLSSHAANIVIGEKHHLASEVLGESREYWVALPASYQAGGYTRYPVLYLLDANLNSFFHVITGMVKQMSADASPQIPEMIVVGIVSEHRIRDSSPTHSLVQYGGKRSDELQVSGGADEFLAFLRTELIPKIESSYSTLNYRIIAGYSFTGLTVVHALYTAPRTFNAYIAIDPSMWWDGQVMLKRRSVLTDGKQFHRRRLFVSTSHRVPSVYPSENYVLQFIEQMRSQPVKGVSFGSAVYGHDENHHTMPVVSFYDGLRFIFEDYMVDAGIQFRPASELRDHFESVSGKLGATFYPREDVVNFYGHDRLYNDQFGADVDRAIEFFRLNTDYYPQSANAWDSLGEGYRVRGDAAAAIAAYQKSLALDPENDNARKWIRNLEAQ